MVLMKGCKGCFCYLIILILFNSCDTSPGVGLGVLHFEDTFTQRLVFYESPDSLTVSTFHVHIIFEDTVKRVSTSLSYQTDTLEFHPLYHGGASISLQVLEQKGDWYKVYTDDIIGVSHWVHVDDREKESWRSFWPTVKKVFSNDSSNPVRENPSDNARAYNLRAQTLCLTVLEVHGAWLKVRNAPDLCPYEYVIQEEFEGFLRWKKDGQVLVNFKM